MVVGGRRGCLLTASFRREVPRERRRTSRSLDEKVVVTPPTRIEGARSTGCRSPSFLKPAGGCEKGAGAAVEAVGKVKIAPQGRERERAGVGRG